MECPEKQTYVCDSEAEAYRKNIVKMVGQIEDEKFLNQIHTILKKHIEKRGG